MHSCHVNIIKKLLFCTEPNSGMTVVQADLAGRDFAGERAQTIVVNAAQPVNAKLSDEERAEVLARHAGAMNIPRRPAWTHDTTASQIQEQERAAFLHWRRRLARCACW
jgi:hypothetical protein